MEYGKIVAKHKKAVKRLKDALLVADSTEQKVPILVELIQRLQFNRASRAVKYAETLLEIGEKRCHKECQGIAYNTIALHQVEQGLFREAQLTCFKSIDLLGQRQRQTIVSYRALAEILTNLGKYDEALDYLNLSISIQKELALDQYLPFTNAQIAKVYYRQGKYEQALQLCWDTLKFQEVVSPIDGWEAFIYHVMGLVYSAQKDFDLTLEKYQESARLWEILGNTFQVTGLYTNIGSTFLNQQNIRAAERYYKRALELDQENANNIKIQSLLYQNLGIVYHRLSEQTLALQHYEKALRMCKKNQDLLGEMHLLFNMAAFYQEDIPKATELSFQSLELAQRIGDQRFMLQNYNHLAELYANAGDYKKAYEFQVKSQQKERLLFGMEKTKAIVNIENEFKSKWQRREMELLKNNNENLKDFAYKATHELKEPLRMIKSYSERLQNRKKFDERGEEYLGYVLTSASYLNAMLNELVEYADAGLEDHKVHKTDLNEVIYTVISNLKRKIESTNAEIFVENLPALNYSLTALVRIFQSLIDNALKFKKEKVAPIITVAYLEEATRHIFKVQDNGIGIAEKDQARVFMIFETLHSKKDYDGKGIGLSIVKKIIQSLGGEVTLSSILGEGTEITFWLPKKKTNDSTN